MSIYIAGSLAYDRIMSFPENFSDHLLPDKLHILNVCFLIDGLIERRGGTAGNIAYALALMGESPYIVSSVGKDFANYRSFLLSLELPLDGVQELPNEFTAGAYITTDKSNNQITAFHPAAMNTPSPYSFSNAGQDGDWGVVSPTNVEDMQNIPRIFKEKKVKYIFDPGQQIPALSSEALINAIFGSALLVSNDYELALICKKTGKTRSELQMLTEGIITTLGGDGCVVYTKNEASIPAAKPRKVIDPTGAGDAFRAGLIKGLVRGLSVTEASELGVVSASFCIEKPGTQEHIFTYADFTERYKKTFNKPLPVSW